MIKHFQSNYTCTYYLLILTKKLHLQFIQVRHFSPIGWGSRTRKSLTLYLLFYSGQTTNILRAKKRGGARGDKQLTRVGEERNDNNDEGLLEKLTKQEKKNSLGCKNRTKTSKADAEEIFMKKTCDGKWRREHQTREIAEKGTISSMCLREAIKLPNPKSTKSCLS